MKKYLTELINSNFFFLSLAVFVFVLPLSVALVSIFAGLVLVVALFEDSWQNKLARLNERKFLLLVFAIFLMYLVSTLLVPQAQRTYYDIKKTLFYFAFPVAFCFGKSLTIRQIRFVFYAFALGIFIAIIAAMCRWCCGDFSEGNFSVHNISLVAHIRFSFQLILIVWFFVLLLLHNYRTISIKIKLLIGALVFIYLAFLFFQQSLTGVIALGTSCIFLLGYLLFRVKSKWRTALLVVFFILLIAPWAYLYRTVHDFYSIDEVTLSELDEFTLHGNRYSHDLNNKMVENGHYVNVYVCNKEMREAWNKRAKVKYDSTGINGYPVSATLVRYLTSKNLRKDAEGVKALTVDDISNIEKGIPNVVYTRKFSLYPRIYETIWEYYIYSETGNSNNKSFSQRIEFAKAAITIIKSHFWFGVGVENWEAAFAKAFKENKSQLNKELYASSHNQYLNYTVKFGIVGFIFIMFAIIYPIIKTRSYRDTLFMLFLVAMFFANFADSNFETHIGSSFFFFFYCFFITQSSFYLKIDSLK